MDRPPRPVGSEAAGAGLSEYVAPMVETVLALLGVVIGGLITVAGQRVNASHAAQLARTDAIRGERMEALSGFASAATAYRRAVMTRRLTELRTPRGSSRYLPELQDAQSEDVRLTRAVAWEAYYRLRLVAPSPGVEEQAREVINAIKGLRASDSLEVLDDAGESVRHRIDALIDDARTDLHGHTGRGVGGRSSGSGTG